jgi:transcriptional regulator GlxA family with amidase domain
MKMTKNGPQLTTREPVNVAIVCYPGAQATCIHGLTDLFSYADFFAREQSSMADCFIRVTHWRPQDNGNELECSYDSHPGPHRAPKVVIVPACQVAPPASNMAPACAQWFAQKHAEGAIVAAVCGGVFVLADSGVLNGRRVTTHWMFAEELARRHPQLQVDADQLMIDEGDLVTAGGVLGWADMGLDLVDKLLGPSVMQSTARFLLMDPPRREQRVYGGFSPRLQHGDKSILSVQHWMRAHSASPVDVDSLARRAGLTPRTFLRRFVKATGFKPSEYHQRLRVNRSRELLELTRQSVEQISRAAGYEDAGGFRRIFKRVMGLSPAEYRKRFQRAAN